MLTRRHLMLGASAAMLSGCKVLDGATRGDSALRHGFMAAEGLTMRAQRLLMGDRLAPEFTRADILQSQHPNGSTDPQTAEYLALAARGFADYRLMVGGMVERPLTLSLADLRGMAVRTQITRHDCVEGGPASRSGQGRRWPLCWTARGCRRGRGSSCSTGLTRSSGACRGP